jgi:diacylglycerol kinase family enzyme
MQCKKACVVINPRAGENFARLTGVLAVLAAAGWQTDIRVKEYPGHACSLAMQAAEEGYDLVMAYGGDGTLNQVINGVLQAGGKRSQPVVGLIPGGTANQWASDMHIPLDPLKAALTLVESETRKIDVGHVEVEKLTFPADVGTSSALDPAQREQTSTTEDRKKQSAGKHYFMLTAGLGLDAAVIESVSKPLKYRVGRLAFAAAAAKNDN